MEAFIMPYTKDLSGKCDQKVPLNVLLLLFSSFNYRFHFPSLVPSQLIFHLKFSIPASFFLCLVFSGLFLFSSITVK